MKNNAMNFNTSLFSEINPRIVSFLSFFTSAFRFILFVFFILPGNYRPNPRLDVFPVKFSGL